MSQTQNQDSPVAQTPVAVDDHWFDRYEEDGADLSRQHPPMYCDENGVGDG